MKRISYLGLIILFMSILSGCGTIKSLNRTETYVQYATINVTDSLTVNGQIININDSIIAISVGGAVVKYNNNNIIGYQKYMAPNSDLMQRDIVKNTKKAASNTDFFVGLTIINFVIFLLI